MNVEKELFMRHPLWLVNSTLLVLFLTALGFAFFSQQKLPRRIKLDPKPSAATEHKSTVHVDIAQIYENDLFNTYHKIIQPPVQPNYTRALPLPPSQTPVTIPAEPHQPFLAPLDIKLKGIIAINDDSNNVAMLAEASSTEQKNYRVGEMIQDARIIRILPNRIILVRSNGQQETLYLNEKDIELDITFAEERDHWMHVLKKVEGYKYLLDPDTFAQVSRNVAQFIDMLDITTVYKKGKSVGCRMGNIAHNSLGSAMGLEPLDIVTHIDGKPILTTEERYSVYQGLLKKKIGDTIEVKGLRDGSEFELAYHLYDLKDPLDESLQELKKEESKAGIYTGPSPAEIEEERIRLLKDKYKFAPTVQDIKIHQKMAMLKEGNQV